MTFARPLKVLLVEDSTTVAAYLVALLDAEPGIELLPVAANAQIGMHSALDDRPNVILMDMKLPDHDGLWAIERIMSAAPCPIIVLSGHLSSRERDITFESLRAGAVEVLAKPTGLGSDVREAFRARLVSTIRLMASAVVVRRRLVGSGAEALPDAPKASDRVFTLRELEPIRVALVGASTGGPELLSRILTALPAPLPFPLLFAQHTLEGFDQSLAQWLSCSGHRVSVARAGDVPVAGRVLLAPADRNMRVGPDGVELIPVQRKDTLSSVDAMFESAAKLWGAQCMAVLLTGMGRDGAAGMVALRDRQALTIAQAAHTCVVPNMPMSAQAAGAVRRVLTPSEIVRGLQELAALRSKQASAVPSSAKET
jgi:two-component system chemotaxis response regulator CheB